jgi:transcriptional regulator MftR-like protein
MRGDEERIAFQRNKVLQEAGADTLIAGPPELTQSFLEVAARRLGVDVDTDMRPHLIVWSVFAAARAATRVWIANAGREPLRGRMESAFEFLLEGLADR